MMRVVSWRSTEGAWATDQAPLRYLLFQGAWGCALLIAAAWHFWVDRPRVRDEIAALELDGGA